MKSGLMGWIGMLCCVACSVLDPDIPEYSSEVFDKLPDVSIEAVDKIYTRQVNLSIRINATNKYVPQKFFLCYSSENDLPDTTMSKVDLLSIDMQGLVSVELSGLSPATLYYSRIYVENRNEKRFSSCFKFRTATGKADEAWTKVSDFPDKKAFYNSFTAIGEDAYFQECFIEGHYNVGGSTLLKYSSAQQRWTRISDFPGGKRCDPVMLILENNLYMGLGYVPYETNRCLYQTDWWKYDLIADSWERMEDYPYYYSTKMAALAFKEKGFLISSPAMWFAEPMYVVMFDPITGKWTKKANFPGRKVANCKALVMKERIFMVGGDFEFIDEGVFSDYLWEYLPDTDTWFRRADFPGGGRTDMHGFVVNDRIYAGYGWEVRTGNQIYPVNDLWEYIPDRDRWEARSTISLWVPSLFTVSFGLQNAGYIGNVQDGLWKYSSDKDK